jgi:hypothetical protein
MLYGRDAVASRGIIMLYEGAAVASRGYLYARQRRLEITSVHM